MNNPPQTSGRNDRHRAQPRVSPSGEPASWLAAGAGVVVLLTAFLPWSSLVTYEAALFGPGTTNTSSRLGIAIGPTVWVAVALAATAAAIVLTLITPSVSLPRPLKRPIALATWLAATALASVTVQALTIGRTTSSFLGMTTDQESVRFGAILAVVAALTQVASLVAGAWLSGTSIRPDLGLRLQPSAEREQSLPTEVRGAAIINFVAGGLNALSGVVVLALALGLSSVPLLDRLGGAVAVIALLPMAAAAWQIVLGVQLIAGRRWARTGTLVTSGILTVVLALATVSTEGDPTIALMATALIGSTVALVCSRAARTFAWT